MARKETQKEPTGKLVPLANLQTELEAELLMDVLRQEDIPVMTKEEGSGGYMKIYMGYSIYGETIYVYNYDYPRAREIMLALQQGSEAAIEAEQEAGQMEAFADADDFDTYETEQMEKQEEAAGVARKNSPVALIVVIIIVIILYGLL